MRTEMHRLRRSTRKLHAPAESKLSNFSFLFLYQTSCRPTVVTLFAHTILEGIWHQVNDLNNDEGEHEVVLISSQRHWLV